MTILSAALLLFLVMDPISNVPFFLTALRDVEPRRQRWVTIRELLIALSVMILFLFLGPFALEFLQISEPALTVAGGVILFLISLKMVFPTMTAIPVQEVQGEPLIVPLAVPYVAGPSVLASVLLIMSREPERWLEWLVALVLAWLGTAGILLSATSLRRVLGKRGLIAVERLMGMVLTAIAVEMLLTGLRSFLSDSG